jgi:hypothetical protein
MDHALEASTQRMRHHLRRPLAGSRDLRMKTAGNTVSETDPNRLVPCSVVRDLAEGCRVISPWSRGAQRGGGEFGARSR